MVKFGKLEDVTPNLDMPIFLYRGNLDASRAKKDNETLKAELAEGGWHRVESREIEGMQHESKPDVCVEWFVKLLKSTAKGRKEAHRIADELEKLRPDVEAAKPGAYAKLQRLAERERKSGFAAGAVKLISGVLAKAKKEWEAAELLRLNNDLMAADEAFKKIEADYRGLDISKNAREHRAKMRQSDEYKACELLAKAQELKEKGQTEKATIALEEIVAKYPDTVAAERAKIMLGG
jgi:TolA-binding protein